MLFIEKILRKNTEELLPQGVGPVVRKNGAKTAIFHSMGPLNSHVTYYFNKNLRKKAIQMKTSDIQTGKSDDVSYHTV